jgi:hypothetical protein
MGLGFGIRDQGSGKNLFQIPDPVVKKAPDPGSGSATLRIAINKLLEWVFSRVLASHRGGPGSIPGRDMSVLGLIVQDEDDLGQVSS